MKKGLDTDLPLILDTLLSTLPTILDVHLLKQVWFCGKIQSFMIWTKLWILGTQQGVTRLLGMWDSMRTLDWGIFSAPVNPHKEAY